MIYWKFLRDTAYNGDPNLKALNTRNKRHGEKGRFVVDAFGPLIDISKLSLFSAIENARTLTEEALAEELNSKNNSGQGKKWDKNRIHEVVTDALVNWSQNPELINATAILKLWHASNNGTEVHIISTTDEELFKTAFHAIKELSTDVSPNAEAGEFTSKKLESRDALQDYLRELDQKEKRYTVVLHDTYAIDMKIDSQLYDEWYPPATGRLKDLTPILERGLERELRMQPVGWLGKTDNIYLDEHKAFGNFLVYSEVQKKTLKKQMDGIKGLMDDDADKPVVVVLCGPSGAGKSFFVEECVHEILNKDLNIVKTDLSSVTDIRTAIAQHVTDLRLGDRVALLDEVDTHVRGEYAYRHLMVPMTGEQVDTLGKFTGRIKKTLWFMAGSVANSRLEWIANCKDNEPKVIDWSNRVSEWIEIPGVRSSDAILQAISHLLRCDKNKSLIKSASKTALLFFALHDWTDARELRRVVKSIYDYHIEFEKADKSLLAANSIKKAVSHRLDLTKCMAQAEDYGESLTGKVGLYSSRK